jgi:hypothetical protein
MAFGMTFNTLKHGNVSEVDWMCEGSIGLVAALTLAIREAAKVDRVLYGYGFQVCCGPRGVRQNRVADIAVIGNHFSCLTDMLAIVTPETTR